MRRQYSRISGRASAFILPPLLRICAITCALLCSELSAAMAAA
jgi:hypothetical protein